MVCRARGTVLIVAIAVGCSKVEEPATRDHVVTPLNPPIQDTSFRYPSAERIVAIGDLHGDMSATRAALRLAGAIQNADEWTGGRLVVVQTGDQLDRGDDEPEIVDLFERLTAQASAAGGALHVLNGNHEVMNVQGDFRYVTADGFQDFADARENVPGTQTFASNQRGRAAAFLPGGSVAKRLAKRPIVIQVGDNVFVHGGLLERHVAYGLGRMNKEVQQWMQGGVPAPAPEVVQGEQSPIWLRLQSDGVPPESVCEALRSTLQWMSAKRLVVGHTVQERGINAACDGRVWRIDVGMSRYYGHQPSVLEIAGDQVRVLGGAPSSPH